MIQTGIKGLADAEIATNWQKRAYQTVKCGLQSGQRG